MEGEGNVTVVASSAGEEEKKTDTPSSTTPSAESPFVVDGRELIKMQVDTTIKELKQSLTDEISKNVIEAVEKKLANKIQLIKTEVAPPTDPAKDYLLKVLKMSEKYTNNNQT